MIAPQPLLKAARRVWPELALLLLGALLRLSFLANHGDANRNFDFVDHKLYIEWFAKNWALPPLHLSRVAYGPPLFYLLGGLGLRVNLGLAFAHTMAIGFGLLRLGLFAWALRWALPGDRFARLFALGLAAVLPAAVHLDGMTNNESLSMLLCWILLASWRWMNDPDPKLERRAVIVAGVALALAMLTKFSAILLAITMAGLALAPWVLSRSEPRAVKLRHSRPWLAALVVALVGCGWYFARNKVEHGLLFPTAFEGNDSSAMTEEMSRTPLLKRRDWSYFLTWSSDIYAVPHYPSGTRSTSHFFPTLTAATFSAYYLVNFSPQTAEPDPETGARFPEPTLSLARASVAGGTLLAFAMAFGLFALFTHGLRRRDWLALGYATASLLALLGQAYFSLKYPIDTYGVTKGTYLQFAAAPMFAVTGLVASRCWRRPGPLRAVSVLMVMSLVCVAAYSLQARWAWCSSQLRWIAHP